MTDMQRYDVNDDGFQIADERGPFVLASDAEAAIAAAEQRGYHEGHGAALIEFILAVVGMDSRRQDEDGQFVVGKGDLERVLGGMVSDNGIYQQAVEKARDNGTEKGLVYGHRIGYAEGQRDMLAKCIAAARSVEGGYSMPLGMSVGAFIEAMRHQFIAVLRDLEETL